MQKNKLLVIGPISSQPSDLDSIAKSLSFLNDKYTIDYLDSLLIMDEVPNDQFYRLWEEKLSNYLNDYDAFLGFSFGGVIIQQCFSLFDTLHKPIILFSTPTFMDESLTQKLTTVITLCQQNRLEEAIHFLYEHVYYPNPIPTFTYHTLDYSLAIKRFVFGLKRILEADSAKILMKSDVNYLHLIGEHSHLVNANHVSQPKRGRLIIVPNAGMRVLESNPVYCHQIILEELTRAKN